MHLNKPHVVFSQAPECLDSISTENRERKTKVTSACFRKQSYLVVCGQRTCSDALESMIVNKPIKGLSLHMLLTGSMYSQEGLSFTNWFPRYWSLQEFGSEREEGSSQKDLCHRAVTLFMLTVQSKAGKTQILTLSFTLRMFYHGWRNRHSLLDPFLYFWSLFSLLGSVFPLALICPVI